MADGDGAAVDVDVIGGQAQLGVDRGSLRGKGLVQLEQVDVLGLQAGLLQGLTDGGDGAGAHQSGIDAHRTGGDDLGHGLQAVGLDELAGGHDDGGSAVVDAGGVAGGDRAAVALKGGLQLGQLLHGGAGLDVLIGVEDDGIALLLGDDHGDDLVLELALGDGGGGTGLAAQGQLILHLAGDAVLFGHVLGGDAHVAVVERIPQAVVDHHVGHGGVVHAGAPAGGIDGVGSHAHALHTAGHNALSLAGHNGAVSDGNAVQTGATHLVQGGGGGLDGQTGLQGGLTGGVLAQTSLQHVAEEQLVDLGGLDAAALQGFLDDQGAQFNGGGALQRAAEAAHSGTSHAYQINFFHVNTLLLYFVVC